MKDRIKTISVVEWFISDCFLALYIISDLLYEHTLLSQVFLALFGLSVFISVLRERKVFVSSFFLCYIGLILWGSLCAFAGWTIDRVVSLDMVKTLCVDFGFLFLLFQYLLLREKMEKPMRVLQIAAACAFVGVIVITWPEVLTDRIGRQYGYMPNAISTVMETGFMFSLYLFYKERKWIDVGATCFFGVAILLTGTRRGMAVATVFAVFMILWSNRKHFFRTLLILVGFAAVAALICFIIPKLKTIVWDRAVQAIMAITGSGSDVSMNARLIFIEEAIPLIKNHPWTGIGMNCFYLVERFFNTYSHNNYLELLLSGGIPALILFYASIIPCFFRCIRKIGASDSAKLAGYLLLRLFLTGLLVISYYERKELLLIVFALALLMKEDENREKYAIRFFKRGEEEKQMKGIE